MAVTQSTIYQQKFSFVYPDYNPPVNCIDDSAPCLPFTSTNDWAWQTQIVEVGNNDGVGRNRQFKATLLKGISCAELPLTGDLPFAYLGSRTNLTTNTGFEALIQFTGSNDFDWDVYNESLVSAGFEAIAPGDCFRIFIYEEVTVLVSGSLIERFSLVCSSCFVRTEGTCYLSRIVYSNNDNAFEFIYVDEGEIIPDVFNSALLPFYLFSPQFNTDNESYVKSNQQAVKLYEVINESWELRTDEMPLDWHRRLDVALSHDTVNIFNVNHAALGIPLSTNFVKNENYEIDWPEPDKHIAVASTKLDTGSAIAYRNNNC